MVWTGGGCAGGGGHVDCARALCGPGTPVGRAAHIGRCRTGMSTTTSWQWACLLDLGQNLNRVVLLLVVLAADSSPASSIPLEQTIKLSKVPLEMPPPPTGGAVPRRVIPSDPMTVLRCLKL
jgi:hypothetical protein